ncbi:MAG: YkgJ family cysteine cluster protein [Chloroflexota bacterium]
MKPLITDLDEIKRLAAQRHDEFDVLRHYLEFRDDLTDAEIDAMVDEIAAPIVAAVDCTQCANCCRSLNVYLVPEDAQRLSDGLHIPLDEISVHYVDHDEAQQVGEWGKFSTSPCAFLKGKLCSVYEHRPETCRTYPMFTPDFRWTLDDTIEGAGLCPIIYNVLSALVERTEKQ